MPAPGGRGGQASQSQERAQSGRGRRRSVVVCEGGAHLDARRLQILCGSHALARMALAPRTNEAAAQPTPSGYGHLWGDGRGGVVTVVQVKRAKSAWFRALRAARLSSSANRAAPDNFAFFALQAPRGG